MPSYRSAKHVGLIKLGQPDWLLYNTPHRFADSKLTEFRDFI